MATTKKELKPTIGKRVAFTRRNGEKAVGKIVGTDDRANGRWVAVNTAAPRQNPKVTNVRVSQLTAA